MLQKAFLNNNGVFKISKIKFDYGLFNFNRITLNSISLLKGKFKLNIDVRFKNDIQRIFWFYELESISIINSKKDKILPDLISLGPYYPWNEFTADKDLSTHLKYPVFSDILLNSKTGKLYNISNSFIIEARKEQLRLLSNFFANYLKANGFTLNHDKIIPVPAKPKYSFNNVEIICQEFKKVFNIPIDWDIIERNSNSKKSYDIKNRSSQLKNIKILLIDDIFTNGTTRDIIRSKLNEIGCSNISMITIGKTDHNIYEYDK